MNTDNIIALFCDVDDFCLKFEPEFNKKLIEDGHKKRNRESTLCLSEVMTITICFHMSAYRTFKDYYTQEVSNHMRWAFPRLVSYNRFVELMSDTLIPLCFYLRTRKGKCSGISFIDSTKIVVIIVVYILTRSFSVQHVVVRPQQAGSMVSSFISLSMMKENCLPFTLHRVTLTIENLHPKWLKVCLANCLVIKVISLNSYLIFSMVKVYS